MAAKEIINIQIAKGDVIDGRQFFAIKIDGGKKKTAWVPITEKTRRKLDSVLNELGIKDALKLPQS